MQSDIATKVAQALGGALAAGEEKRLSDKPTQNLAAYDAFLKGEEASNGLAAVDPPSVRKALGFYDQAVALDPGFAQAWARVSYANSLLYANSTPTAELADRARQAGEKAVALAPNRPEGTRRWATYERSVAVDLKRALEQYEKGLRVAPGHADPSSQERRLPSRASGAGMRRWSISDRRSAWIPGPSNSSGVSAKRFSGCDAIPRRAKLSTVASPSRPPTSSDRA